MTSAEFIIGLTSGMAAKATMRAAPERISRILILAWPNILIVSIRVNLRPLTKCKADKSDKADQADEWNKPARHILTLPEIGSACKTNDYSLTYFCTRQFSVSATNTSSRGLTAM